MFQSLVKKQTRPQTNKGHCVISRQEANTSSSRHKGKYVISYLVVADVDGGDAMAEVQRQH